MCLSKAEARAMDAIVVFGSSQDAAKYLGISKGTLNLQLARAYKAMIRAGYKLDNNCYAKRIQAIALWVTYWWSDEGKACLRNPSLTQPPVT